MIVLCCTDCFKDKYIKSVFNEKGARGHCNYCDKKSIKCLPIEDIAEVILTGVSKFYVSSSALYLVADWEHPAQQTLIDILRNERLFSDELIKNQRDIALLDDILNTVKPTVRELSQGDEDYFEDGAHQLMVRAAENLQKHGFVHSRYHTAWEGFCDFVRYRGRFFDHANTHSRMEIIKPIRELFQKLEVKLPIGTVIWRARLLSEHQVQQIEKQIYSHDRWLELGFYEEYQKSPPRIWRANNLTKLQKDIISINEFGQSNTPIQNICYFIGPPPFEKAVSNRMNPIGIPYFYGSNEKDVCIKEVQPFRSAKIFIGKFVTKRELSILDFTSVPKVKVDSIFNPSEPYFASGFIKSFIGEISSPFNEAEKEMQYIPTQVLSEYIRTLNNYDGFTYKSSLSRQGKNYTLFLGPKPIRGEFDDEDYGLEPFYDSLSLDTYEYVEISSVSYKYQNIKKDSYLEAHTDF